MVQAIAPLVGPHYLLGIAAGAGMIGTFMVEAGFGRDLNDIPAPILRYPIAYVSCE